MKVTGLRVSNLRSLDTAQFRFQDGFNLIVGTNGVGKSSILEALAVSLARVVKHTNGLKSSASFTDEDIRVGANALTVECSLRIGNDEYSYLVHMPRETSMPRIGSTGQPREQTIDTPARSEFLGEAPPLATSKTLGGMPFALFFSTRRAVPADRAPSKGAVAGGVRAALAEAFIPRSLRLAEISEWIRARSALEVEGAAVGSSLVALNNALRRFLPGYSNLRLTDSSPPILVIDRGEATIPVRKLSDGERGALALMLDMTRRLVLANPHMDDPAAEAQGVILIDEIELHLHPKWQREIVHNLTEAFPNCQFVATTHSPQIIGAVEAQAINLYDPHTRQWETPHQSFGMDSNWILKVLMGGDQMDPHVSSEIEKVVQHARAREFQAADEVLTCLREKVGNSEEVQRAASTIERMRLLGE